MACPPPRASCHTRNPAPTRADQLAGTGESRSQKSQSNESVAAGAVVATASCGGSGSTEPAARNAATSTRAEEAWAAS
ncbi:hypothetical protein MUN84_13020 [Hymenobacter sp. 5516J-16]|uniref:hypothetical protein n=1 Tax=Hymenobacter sp. 5516J-16 TaxID=2932253 RepID=UPI001FD0AA4C|nr:hypothetical protein [Hymenobacter sp. 5516J-16]UOQ75607.1 hypothetical protein MUN84_13020 [Hymenobacter sp. 5516J-16]